MQTRWLTWISHFLDRQRRQSCAASWIPHIEIEGWLGFSNPRGLEEISDRFDESREKKIAGAVASRVNRCAVPAT